MRITITETQRGSEDGITVKTFEAGRTVDMADSLAAVFLREGWATEAGKPDPGPGPEAGAPASGPSETKVTGPSETGAGKRRGK